MGQIVRRKKKGRPSKADLARRAGIVVENSPAPESDVRRSLRRRNVKYNIDYDDYLDEDDEDEDEEDERRREKKLKLVLKLPSGDSVPSRTRTGARDVDAHESEEDFDNRRTNRKNKMDGGDDATEECEDKSDGDDSEERGRQGDSKGHDSIPGTPSDHPSGAPLPDKKTLELILDKIQKKDTYGVYAEPVDPEELPDYHDIIEHPMDFATVRKKLSNGSYSAMEQFESDVYLICSNAMQYNAPDTIYYKQARAIQELARKHFVKLSIDVEHSEKELKSEQKTTSNSLPLKQTKRSDSRTSQEPVGSDFWLGATLATAADYQNNLNVNQAGTVERPSNVDRHIESNSSFNDTNLEKAEEILSGKGLPLKFGRKPIVLDENRRATYNSSNQPLVKSDSILSTFQGEQKQMVAVGLHAEYSYARSLACFAATLGPTAWRVASKRIEQALPAGFKFGRGWVGEYEPLPTPVLIFEHRSHKGPSCFTKLQGNTGLRQDDRTSETSVSAKDQPVNRTNLEGKPSIGSAALPAIKGKPSLFGSPVNTIYQQQNSLPRNHAAPVNKVGKQVELNSPPTAVRNKESFVATKQLSTSPKMASEPKETLSRDLHFLHPMPFKQPDSNGAVSAGLPNGKVVNNSLDGNRLVSSSSDTVPSQLVRAGTYSQHTSEQGLSDPVQLMRMLAEKAQKQQQSSNNSPVDSSPVMPSVSSSKRDDSSNNAAAAAARAWMSIGAGGFRSPTENSSPQRSQISADSLYNPARDLPSQMSRFRGEFPMQFQSERNSFLAQASVPQPARMATEAQFQSRPIVFPHLMTPDLSRFQVQTPWRGLNPQNQPRQKQDTLPPDLNISFQSSGSPVKQSSGVLVDSQQPDLALQL